MRLIAIFACLSMCIAGCQKPDTEIELFKVIYVQCIKHVQINSGKHNYSTEELQDTCTEPSLKAAKRLVQEWDLSTPSRDAAKMIDEVKRRQEQRRQN